MCLILASTYFLFSSGYCKYNFEQPMCTLTCQVTFLFCLSLLFLMSTHYNLYLCLFVQSSDILLKQIMYFLTSNSPSMADRQIRKRDLVSVPSTDTKSIVFLFDVSSSLGIGSYSKHWRNNLPLIGLGDWHLDSYQPSRLPSSFHSYPLPPLWILAFVIIQDFLSKTVNVMASTIPNVKLHW